MNWKIYLLDDAQGRHDLLNPKNGQCGLIDELNSQAAALGSPHRFAIGFTSTTPTLGSASINTALGDSAGIWLVDLHIPQSPSVGPASEVVPYSGTGDLDLARAAMQALQARKRKFLMISSQNVANAPFNQVAAGFSADSMTFDAPNDIAGAVQNILALVVPELIYRRAFEEAQGAFGVAAFHAATNGGGSVAMFDRSSPLHDLADWDRLYSEAPQHEVTAIQDTIKSLMDTWALNLSSLSSFRAGAWHQNWRLAAAKAINNGSIHRSFFFALPPESCANGCTPFVRKRICDRDMRNQQPHLGILGLQILLQGGRNEGFRLSEIAEWTENGRSGIQLTLTARFEGCEGVARFGDVISGAWQPPEAQPNSGRLSRALKDVRDSFLTDQSNVLCIENAITLIVRIEEAELR